MKGVLHPLDHRFGIRKRRIRGLLVLGVLIAVNGWAVLLIAQRIMELGLL